MLKMKPNKNLKNIDTKKFGKLIREAGMSPFKWRWIPLIHNAPFELFDNIGYNPLGRALLFPTNNSPEKMNVESLICTYSSDHIFIVDRCLDRHSPKVNESLAYRTPQYDSLMKSLEKVGIYITKIKGEYPTPEGSITFRLRNHLKNQKISPKILFDNQKKIILSVETIKLENRVNTDLRTEGPSSYSIEEQGSTSTRNWIWSMQPYVRKR